MIDRITAYFLRMRKFYLVVLLLLFFSMILCWPITHVWGLPFVFDWSWPLFDLRFYWQNIVGAGSLGILSEFGKSGPALFGLLGLLKFSPVLFFKIFVIFVHLISGCSLFLFLRKRVKSDPIALAAGFAYAFSAYLFIRTIVGFTWSMTAYAVLPIFLIYFFKPKKNIIDYLISGLLFSFIFSQSQAGLLTLLIISVSVCISLFGQKKLEQLRNYLFTMISLLAISIPWMIVSLFHSSTIKAVSGNAATTLGYITMVPHSLRNMFMLSDHQITSTFFYTLSHNKLFLIGWLIVWFVAFCAIFNKKNRELAWTLIISCLIVLPFIKGPLGIFGGFYVWFYNHIPQIAIFRETYHFEFLYAISLCVLFAFGLDWLWEKLDSHKVIKLKVIKSKQAKSSDFLLTNNLPQTLTSSILTGLKAVLAGSAIFIIAPYLTFDYAGYLKMQKIPSDYVQLHNFFQENGDFCKKIYYPPGLGFIYFKDQNNIGASNTDTLANAIGISYLDDGTTYSYLPSDERYFRNELVSQFYEKTDNGEFAGLLNEGGIDCVVLRLDTESKYDQASNLWQEKNPEIVKKWNQTDLLSLTRSKVGLSEDKKFGDDIYVFKISNSELGADLSTGFQPLEMTDKLSISNQIPNPNDKMLKIGKPAAQQFISADNLQPASPAGRLTTYNLPLTDWANDYAYYKDGWSRGRYDFWRKHLFTQLRQDFIYTDKTSSTLNGQIDKKGDYELWARYLTGGAAGEIELRIKNYELRFQKDAGEERFIWKKLGDIQLNGPTEVKIENISGENAIADIVLVAK